MDGLAWADAAKRRRATEREELLRQATPLADVVHGFVIEFVFARELRARPSGSNARGLSDASVLRYSTYVALAVKRSAGVSSPRPWGVTGV